jgi:hypothetical protein
LEPYRERHNSVGILENVVRSVKYVDKVRKEGGRLAMTKLDGYIIITVFVISTIVISVIIHRDKRKKLKEESSAQFRVHQAYARSHSIDFSEENKLFTELKDSGDFYSRAITSRYKFYSILVETITSENVSIPECSQVAVNSYYEHIKFLTFLISSHKARLSHIHNESRCKVEKMLSVVQSDNADYINNYPK